VGGTSGVRGGGLLIPAQVGTHGPSQLQGEARLLANMDSLLQLPVKDQLMKLGEGDCKPCCERVK
jgi:hypothetical protein